MTGFNRSSFFILAEELHFFVVTEGTPSVVPVAKIRGSWLGWGGLDPD